MEMCGCEEAERDQNGERRDLQHDQHIEHAAAWFDTKEVDYRQDEKRGNGERDRRQLGLSDQSQRVSGKGNRDGGNCAGFDDGEKRPSIQEAGEGMKSVAEVRVLTADSRKDRAEL